MSVGYLVVEGQGTGVVWHIIGFPGPCEMNLCPLLKMSTLCDQIEFNWVFMQICFLRECWIKGRFNCLKKPLNATKLKTHCISYYFFSILTLSYTAFYANNANNPNARNDYYGAAHGDYMAKPSVIANCYIISSVEPEWIRMFYDKWWKWWTQRPHDDHEIKTHLYNIHTINGVDFVC